jgi:hypothetical protein
VDIVATRSQSISGSRFGVDLYWLPLGARGRWLRLIGRTYEAIAAFLAGRQRLDIYHSALEVFTPEGRFVIEMGRAVDCDPDGRRGVVGRGEVGAAWAAVLRLFRYEVRCWSDGITAFEYAVECRCLTEDARAAQRVVELVPAVPRPVWGRDDLGAGEMWTCNSLTSWLLAQTALCDLVRPPDGRRAPGWDAGLVVGDREA